MYILLAISAKADSSLEQLSFEVTEALFATRYLDDYYPALLRAIILPADFDVLPDSVQYSEWSSYLVYRIYTERESSKIPLMGIKRAAEIICEKNGVSGEKALQGYVEQLCTLSVNNDAFMKASCCLNTSNHFSHHWTAEYFKGEQTYTYGAGTKGQLPLLTAAAYLNCIPLVKELVGEGYNTETCIQILGSPARAAAIKGNSEVLEILLSCSASSAPSERLRAIDGAISASQLETLDLALSFTACNFADCPAIAFTWLHALRKFCFQSVEIFSRVEPVLLKHTYDTKQSLPAFLAKAVTCQDNLDVVKYLLDRGAPINRSISRSINRPPTQKQVDSDPLRHASRYGSIDAVKVLLQRGADVESGGYTLKPRPLSIAAARGHLGIVRLLLDHGADPNAGTPPPIVSAVRLEYVAMFKLLRKRGAIFGNSETGVITLKEAIVSGWESMVVLLLEEGAKSGGNMLHTAVQNQQFDIARMIREHQEAELRKHTKRPSKSGWKLFWPSRKDGK